MEVDPRVDLFRALIVIPIVETDHDGPIGIFNGHRLLNDTGLFRFIRVNGEMISIGTRVARNDGAEGRYKRGGFTIFDCQVPVLINGFDAAIFKIYIGNWLILRIDNDPRIGLGNLFVVEGCDFEIAK